ncbi:MAG: putative protease [Desulforhopalus sp.]|jgi:putative protease
MIPKLELLAPGGDVDSIKAAIVAGADAIYCGLDRFNARNRAENISFDQLLGILRLAHSYNVQVFLTLNIIIVESEIPALIQLLSKLSNTSIDGIILQDFGMLYLTQKYFKGLEIHGSTQLTTHNVGQIKFLAELGVGRVNLSRELNIAEIQALTKKAHDQNLMVEVFVHGSNCLSFSGLCYISSVFDGKSGNRGRCAQPCRSQYLTTVAGNDFPLNLKDNSAYGDLASLAAAGVDSIKIEGRIKKFHYVYTIVQTWRNQLEQLYSKNRLSADNAELYKVFNRGFSNGFLTGEIHRDMFIDNPRDNSAIHLASTFEGEDSDNLEQAKRQLYDQKTDIIVAVREKIDKLSIDKAPLTITLAGQENKPLQVIVKTPDSRTTILSESLLAQGPTGDNTVNLPTLKKLLKNIKDTEYYIEHIGLDDLEKDLLLPFRELSALKKKIFTIINNGKKPISPVTLPRLTKQSGQPPLPSLALLISSEEDLALCQNSDEVYFELPNSLGKNIQYYENLFTKNLTLIPWFPAVLIGEDYTSAVELLKRLHPRRIVTNNTGIACDAYRLGIDWVAGPYLNIVNSYSLLCLKETLNCSGAFISNELNHFQIKAIKAPENFLLYYSIYHPIILMTSRQCLFHQVTGCEKSIMDSSCISSCQRSSSLTTMDKGSIIIKKEKGNYHTLYNNHNFLNIDITQDTRNIFNRFFVDLRDIETETAVTIEKREMVQLFRDLIRGNDSSEAEIRKRIQPTTDQQYAKGI